MKSTREQKSEENVLSKPLKQALQTKNLNKKEKIKKDEQQIGRRRVP